MKNFYFKFFFIVCFSLFSCTTANPDLYSSEIESLQKELKYLTKARELLQSDEPSEMLTLLPYTDSNWKLAKFLPKCILSNQEAISATAFITLKPMPNQLHTSNIGLLIAYSNGLLELREITGTLLFILDLGYETKHIISTNSYDEIRFACITPRSSIEIYSIVIEKSVRAIEIEKIGSQTNKIFVSISKEIESDLEEQGISALFYIRGGKKFWVIGGENGTLTYFNFAGKKESSAQLGIGPILALERFGPQLIVASSSVIGLMNMNNQEIQQKCPIGGSYIVLDAINATSVIYSVNNEEVVVLDTRSVVDEKIVCKSNL